MTTSKLRIKIGEVEIDIEATEGFLKAEVPVLLKAAMDLAQIAPTKRKLDTDTRAPSGDGPNLSGTTTTIAARLDAKTGPKLLLAAAAHLTFVAKKDTFTREEALEQMRSAVSYFNKNYVGNLSKIIGGAIKDGNISENSKNVFALTAKARADLEPKIANA